MRLLSSPRATCIFIFFVVCLQDTAHAFSNNLRGLINGRTRGDDSGRGGAGSSASARDQGERRTYPPEPSVTRSGLQSGCILDSSRFNICLDLQSDYDNTGNWMSVFPLATAKWESIIIGDLSFEGFPAVASSTLERLVQSRCSGYPDSLDDLYICAKDEEMDGPAKTLGYAYISVTAKRSQNDSGGKTTTIVQPVVGEMRFDRVDIMKLIDYGVFDDVVLHEIGHILGVGSLWSYNGLVNGGVYNDWVGNYETRASREWHALGCSESLPLETDFGPGTRFSHFDEDCLQDEIMTGFAELGTAPISRITIGTLEDLGYAVDMSQADDFRREDLGVCCQYCSGGTKPCPGHLNPGRDLMTGNTTTVGSSRQRRLSDAGQAAVLEFAKEKLPRLRRQGHGGGGAQDPLLEGLTPEQNLQYIGGDFIHVLYQEGDDIFGMVVSWDMVR